MTDLGALSHFLGMSVLSQCHYMVEILDRAGMSECKPCSTPIDTNAKLAPDSDPVFDATHFRSLAGALQYPTFTRPDISYAVQQIYLFMHDRPEPHLTLIKRLLCYIKGTLDYGLQIHRSTFADLITYSDAD